jgi:hypothetical protein
MAITMHDHPDIEELIADLVKRHRTVELAGPPLRDHDGVQRGDIFVAHSDPRDSDVMGRYVLVDRVEKSENYVSVLLLGNLPSYADDYCLILRPEESGLAFESVIYANVRAPLWITQLCEYRGMVSEEVLDLLPDAAEGAVIDSHARRTGPPLRSREDPRREHKRHELAELQLLSASCTSALLEGSGFFAGRKSPEGTEALQRIVNSRGIRQFITRSYVFTPDHIPSRHEQPELVGTVALDPGVLHAELEGKTAREVMYWLCKDFAETAAILPFFSREELDDFVQAIRSTFGDAESEVLLRALGPKMTESLRPRSQYDRDIPMDELRYQVADPVAA